MKDFPAFKRSAVRYWERRRLIYNAALVLPAWLGYEFTDMMNWVGDRHERYYGFTISLLVAAVIGANICYTFAYALEFLRGSDDPSSNWLRQERTLCFVFGVLFAMLLALIGGRNIALAEWSYGASQRRLSSRYHDPSPPRPARIPLDSTSSRSSGSNRVPGNQMCTCPLGVSAVPSQTTRLGDSSALSRQPVFFYPQTG